MEGLPLPSMTMATTHRSRKAVPTDLMPRVSLLLRTSTLSVAEVAEELGTHKRYVRELADREQLPTNRFVAPCGHLASRVRTYTDRYGFDAALRKFRFSHPKLKSVLAS